MNRVTEGALAGTAAHGAFGMKIVDALHEELPSTECDACGECCFSISFYSLEYHRIVSHLAEAFPLTETRRFLYRALHEDERRVDVGGSTRFRCLFQDRETKRCRIYPVRPFMCRVFGQIVDGVQECRRVRVAEEITWDRVESLAARVASVSESFPVAFPDGEDRIDFFPFEFWLRRTLEGPKKALAWWRASPFFAKVRKHRRLHLGPCAKEFP